MAKAKFVTEITVTDPDSQLPVEMEVYKHENGGMFAVDASYLDQCFDDGKDPVILDPFAETQYGDDTVKLTGL